MGVKKYFLENGGLGNSPSHRAALHSRVQDLCSKPICVARRHFWHDVPWCRQRGGICCLLMILSTRETQATGKDPPGPLVT